MQRTSRQLKNTISLCSAHQPAAAGLPLVGPHSFGLVLAARLWCHSSKVIGFSEPEWTHVRANIPLQQDTFGGITKHQIDRGLFDEATGTIFYQERRSSAGQYRFLLCRQGQF